MKKNIYFQTTLLVLCFLYMLIFTKSVFNSTLRGIKLSLYLVIPTLLPFMILSNYIVESTLSSSIFEIFHTPIHLLFRTTKEGTYAFVIGFLCGFPMGIKTTCDLYNKGLLSKDEALYLSTISNNASPMFIIAFIHQVSLHRTDLALYSIGILILSNYCTSLITRRFYSFAAQSTTQKQTKKVSELPPFSRTLDTSILRSIITVAKLAGYIILFTILVDGLARLLSPFTYIKYLVLGMCEITTGITYIAQTLSVFQLAYPLILSITAMGGLCVVAQTQNLLSANQLSIKPYVLSKLANMLLTFILAFFLLFFL